MAIKATAITVTLTAITAATGIRKTGDSANISVRLIKDGTSGARHDATAIAETDATNCPGEYTVVLDTTDTNANVIVVTGKSSTSGVEIIPVKIVTEQGTIATMQGNVTSILEDTGTTLDTKINTIDGIVDDILLDTGTTLDALIKDVPTVAEFEARTRLAAEYALTTTLMNLHADYNAAKTAASQTSVNDIPTVAEFEARTILASNYALEATLTTIDGLIDSILADTNELQTDWVNSGRLDALIDAIKAKTDLIPASPAAVGSAMTVSDKTGFSLSSAGIQAVWEYSTRTLSSFGTLVADTAAAVWAIATSALTGAGTIGKLLASFVFTTPGKVDATATATVDEAAIAAAVIAGLGGATITVQSPISQNGDIVLIRGVDYTAELLITYTYTGSLTGYTAKMNSLGAGITNKAVAIGGSAGAYTLTVAFTKAQSAALTECLDDYSITFTKTADSTVLGYGVEGNITVRDWAGI